MMPKLPIYPASRLGHPDVDLFMAQLRETIKAKAQKAGSLEVIAQSAGVPMRWLHAFQRQEIDNPNFYRVVHIARHVGVRVTFKPY